MRINYNVKENTKTANCSSCALDKATDQDKENEANLLDERPQKSKRK